MDLIQRPFKVSEGNPMEFRNCHSLQRALDQFQQLQSLFWKSSFPDCIVALYQHDQQINRKFHEFFSALMKASM